MVRIDRVSLDLALACVAGVVDLAGNPRARALAHERIQQRGQLSAASGHLLDEGPATGGRRQAGHVQAAAELHRPVDALFTYYDGSVPGTAIAMGSSSRGRRGHHGRVEVAPGRSQREHERRGEPEVQERVLPEAGPQRERGVGDEPGAHRKRDRRPCVACTVRERAAHDQPQRQARPTMTLPSTAWTKAM